VEAAHYNLNTQEAEARDPKFKVSLGYISRLCQKEKRERERERQAGSELVKSRICAMLEMWRCRSECLLSMDKVLGLIPSTEKVREGKEEGEEEEREGERERETWIASTQRRRGRG
jgi:hypothetical protein